MAKMDEIVKIDEMVELVEMVEMLQILQMLQIVETVEIVEIKTKNMSCLTKIVKNLGVGNSRYYTINPE